MCILTQPRPRKKQPRTCGWLFRTGPDTGTLHITVGRKMAVYALAPVQGDFGRCFRMARLDGDVIYEVCVDGPRSWCECKGFCKHSDCRHIGALGAMIRRGQL